MRSTRVFSGRQELHGAAAPGALDKQAFRLRDLVPAAVLLASGLTALLVASVWSDAADGKYIVVAPTDWSLSRTIGLVRSADGRLLQRARIPNVIFASSASPDFASHLRAAGAWLVEPAPLPPGCSISEEGSVP
ncbi:hypothetical protein EDF59_11689 [Novosphingobium sp. ST904]|nr:hypothetical protein EDF59_11689 [Novosphingobium sp. ST904]